ncbi:unnamed protein product [Echinostoma caproni]|uniref:Transposase n=1 Tax=Echinostoma caproni TaxID=27848 RepID=A0A183B0Z1_9TREM|nr:unnamed protein product [Echinostoma caproni]
MRKWVHTDSELRRLEATERLLAVGRGVKSRDQGVLRGGPLHLLRASSSRVQHCPCTALEKRSEGRQQTMLPV